MLSVHFLQQPCQHHFNRRVERRKAMQQNGSLHRSLDALFPVHFHAPDVITGAVRSIAAKVALIAVVRKLLTLLNAMVRDGKPWQENYSCHA